MSGEGAPYSAVKVSTAGWVAEGASGQDRSPDLHQMIVDLETEIEDLSEAAERCRRMMLAAQAAIIAGLLALAVAVTGLIRFGPLLLVMSIGAVLGGIALFGSTRSTRDQIIATRKLREAQRAETIGRLEPQEVGGG